MDASIFPASAARDDTLVRYELFLLRSSSNTDHGSTRSEAERVRDECLAFAERQTRQFLWHRERFHLEVQALPDALAQASGGDTLLPFYLAGSTSVGDAVMDEWVVAALVVALTEQHKEIVARLHDSDGEFLLIECADALPDWVTPENTEHRVLLKNGKLILPRPSGARSSSRRRQRPAEQSCPSALIEAFDLVINSSDVKTFEASAAVQRVLDHKLLQDVPRYLKENRHRVRCLLPTKAAKVFSCRPELVAPAVEAFYYREPKSAGIVCGKMAVFGGGGKEEVVERMMTFSRAMFAQLKQQRFHPPKPFLSVGSRFNMLLLPESPSTGAVHIDTTAADIGMKLTCGLELLYASDSTDQFGAKYRSLIDEALAPQMIEMVDDSSASLQPDDDDSWLNVHPDSLEEQLATLGQPSSSSDNASNDGGGGGAEELQTIASMFNSFMGGTSDISGVQGANPIQFDMSSFMDILNGGAPPGSGSDFEASSEDGSDDDEFDEDSALAEAMAEMEAELSSTSMAKSFVRPDHVDEDDVGSDDEAEEVQPDAPTISPNTPLDLDYNLLSNLLESFASQDGHAGPVSNILSELKLPHTARDRQ